MSNTHFIPKGTIVSGFAGIGKTTAALKYDNVIDLESSQFFFQLPENLTNEDYEKLKGDTSRQANPNGLSDYIEAIIDAQKHYDYVLIAMFPQLIQELNNRNIDVQIVVPDLNDKHHYEKRYKDRGNQSNWINNMVTNWEKYVDPTSPSFITNNLKNPIKEPIVLHTRESLSDIIDGNVRFKPQQIVNDLTTSLSEYHVQIKQESMLKNIITIKYLFENIDDHHTYHQITVNLTPLAGNNYCKAKENDVEIMFEQRCESTTIYDDFTPKFRYLEIKSDADIYQLHNIIKTLVVNDIQFTKTLKRLNFELLY